MSKLRENDNWGVGQMADGKVPVYTPEQARQMIAERDADEVSTDISDIDDYDGIMMPKGAKDAALSPKTALVATLKRDKMRFLKGLRRINVIPDTDQWNADYNDKTDQVTLRRKFLSKTLAEQVNILLHEAGHRGQSKNPQLFAAFKKAGLGTVKDFRAMANAVHQKDYIKNGIANPDEEAFAESYSRFCLDLPMPNAVRAFWRKVAK